MSSIDADYFYTVLVYNRHPEALAYVKSLMERTPLVVFDNANGETVQIYGRRSE